MVANEERKLTLANKMGQQCWRQCTHITKHRQLNFYSIRDFITHGGLGQGLSRIRWLVDPECWYNGFQENAAEHMLVGYICPCWRRKIWIKGYLKGIWVAILRKTLRYSLATNKDAEGCFNLKTISKSSHSETAGDHSPLTNLLQEEWWRGSRPTLQVEDKISPKSTNN